VSGATLVTGFFSAIRTLGKIHPQNASQAVPRHQFALAEVAGARAEHPAGKKDPDETISSQPAWKYRDLSRPQSGRPHRETALLPMVDIFSLESGEAIWLVPKRKGSRFRPEKACPLPLDPRTLFVPCVHR